MSAFSLAWGIKLISVLTILNLCDIFNTITLSFLILFMMLMINLVLSIFHIFEASLLSTYKFRIIFFLVNL